MEERKINITRNDDTTLVQDDNEKLLNSLKKHTKDIGFNLSCFITGLEKGTLTEGMKYTHLSLIENYVVDMMKTFDYEKQLRKEKEERYNEIRSLNQENRELRRQLGGKVSNEDVREKLKLISNQFKAWWNIEGLGHTKEIKFIDYGQVEVILSGVITDPYRSEKETTIKDKLNKLRGLGFVFSDDECDDDKELLASDNNIRVLEEFLHSKYPSAKILEYNTWMYQQKNRYKEIKIRINNLDDFSC